MRASTRVLRALIDAIRINRSGLLHVLFYRSQFHQELGADRYLLRLFPCLHYALFGARENKNPNPFFDTEYYRDSNTDIAQSGLNPLSHFLLYGARQRKNPSSFFDTGYYLDNHPEVGESRLNPLQHFLRHGRAEGRYPSPLSATIRHHDRPLGAENEEGRTWLQKGLGPSAIENPRRPPRPDRIIRFEWDKGGWNNIRMQAEVMVCLAELSGRTLVLPMADRWYLVPGNTSHLFDFFDEQDFRATVPVLPSHSRSKDEWEVPAHLSAINTVRLKREVYLRQQDRGSWYFPRSARMFGCLAGVFGSDPELYSLVHRALRVRTDLLDTAAAMLENHGLRPGGYLAAHVRRGDFQYRAMRLLGVEKVIEAFRKHGADAAGTLLIVSDAYDEALLEGCRRQGWNPICWAERHPGAPKFSGVLDMLCCCLAWRFVGTRLSTFSSGIMQWRGYVSRVAGAHVDAVPRFTVELDQVYWWANVDQHAWLSDPVSSGPQSGHQAADTHGVRL